MFCVLPIELAALKMAGNLIGISGWTGALGQRCCNMWEIRIISERITHHSNRIDIERGREGGRERGREGGREGGRDS